MTQSSTSQSRRSQERVGFSPDRTWFKLIVLTLLLMFWLFAWWIERIDPRTLNTYLTNSFFGLPLPLPLVTLGSFFMPRVLRHFVPLYIGYTIAKTAAIRLVQTLYDLKDREQASDFLNRLSSPNASSGLPLLLNTQKLESVRRNDVRLRIGGPGLVSMHAGHVAVTEINGRYYRVLGAGVHSLARFEYIRAVLDLRPQQREANEISVFTKDGVKITADISVTYRISTGGQPATTHRPYPYDTDSVRRLAYTETNMGGSKIARWESSAINATRGALAAAVREMPLDELHFDSRGEPYMAIRHATERKARETLSDNGIDLLRVRITRMSLPEDVSEQYISYWRTLTNTQAYLALADGEAEALQEREVAKADAELRMIQAIVEGVERAQSDGRTAHLNELVAVRLVEALENMARQSQTNTNLPDNMLPQLAALRSRLNSAEILPPPGLNPNQPE